MMVYRRYPPGAAEFINANKITGRVMHDWRWEGFLHWQCPQLQLYIGGRAQQVYSLETFRQVRDIVSSLQHTRFSDLGIHLVVLPQEDQYKPLIDAMVSGKDARWAIIYTHEQNMVLADVTDAGSRQLIERAVKGDLIYPDKETAAVSRAMCLMSRVVGAKPAELVDAFVEANKVYPTIRAYNVLYQLYRQGVVPSSALAPYLVSEYERLGTLDTRGYYGRLILICRNMVTRNLVDIATKERKEADRNTWLANAAKVEAQIQQIEREWSGSLWRELLFRLGIQQSRPAYGSDS
jgi:hypothetical protein